jgi:uncharacterized protein YyaL (SSP411 family)
VFLTPELEPFYAGTYFPPRGAYGRPGFADVLVGLANAWKERRKDIAQQAQRMARHIAEEGRGKTSAKLDPAVLDRSLAALQQGFDPQWGGFGGAPKFPHALDLRLLLRHALRTREAGPREMVVLTLDRMAEGGVYDQLGGGFHRYSTDEKWLIPHFEKMLYDNALLIPAYLEAHLATGNLDYVRVARESCDWALREMVTPTGGFASTQDADSEGEEGKFFAWTPDELAAALGPRLGAWAAEWFDVTEEGNFEHGKSALWRHVPASTVAAKLGVAVEELTRAMREARATLFAARDRRVHPGTDDKVLASWNGLMISALAQAFQVLHEPRYLAAARKAADYVLTGMRQPDGRLFATARNGRAHLNAYLDDYAFMIQALIDLYESDFDERWIREALALDGVLTAKFSDEEFGGYFTTGSDHEQLIARLKNPHDGALPSGNGVQALNSLRLAELTGRSQLATRAERTIEALGALANHYPAAFSQLLIAADFVRAGPREVVIAGERDHAAVEAMLAAVRRTFVPQRVVALASAGSDSDLIPLLEARTPGPSGARAYVCRNYACTNPTEDPRELARLLAE